MKKPRTAAQIKSNFKRDRRATVKALLKMEKAWGHQGVLVVLRDWINKPQRGNFEDF